MKLRAEQLTAQLSKQLLPIYVISGDEPLLLQEAADQVRAAARAADFTSRELLHADKSFDWGHLGEAANTLSLFAERRLLELRLPGGKPGTVGGKALMEYAERPPEDTVLMLICPKLDASAQKSKWFTSLERAGASVQIWPPEASRLPAWIGQRLSARGLRAGPEALDLLAQRVEGNLLAAAQEVEKLHLLFGEGELSVEQIADAVADSARFDIYGLADAALAGEGARAVRILNGLREEGVEPVLVLWALARELRGLAQMRAELAGGKQLSGVMAEYRVWQNRQATIKAALRRHDLAACRALLARAAMVDRAVKGFATGNPWEHLLQLALAIAGVPLPAPAVTG